MAPFSQELDENKELMALSERATELLRVQLANRPLGPLPILTKKLAKSRMVLITSQESECSARVKAGSMSMPCSNLLRSQSCKLLDMLTTPSATCSLNSSRIPPRPDSLHGSTSLIILYLIYLRSGFFPRLLILLRPLDLTSRVCKLLIVSRNSLHDGKCGWRGMYLPYTASNHLLFPPGNA
jgi:hypothetical protein